MGIAGGMLLLIGACILSTPESPSTSRAPPPSTTVDSATSTPDTQALIEAATLHSIDFETGYPPELYDWPQAWHVVEENGNSIFCNEISDDRSSFLFGLDAWEDYGISLRLKFLTANQNQGAEMYFRINASIDGYRPVSLATNGRS